MPSSSFPGRAFREQRTDMIGSGEVVVHFARLTSSLTTQRTGSWVGSTAAVERATNAPTKLARYLSGMGAD